MPLQPISIDRDKGRKESEMEITYWSDYACPYCYIGETRLHNALNQLGLQDVHLSMKAFQLDPNAPVHCEGDTTGRYAKKYGQTMEQAKNSVLHISQLGEAEGLAFNYADTKFTNTMDAHRLTKFAQSKGDPDTVNTLETLLFEAYFAKGLELADHKVLMDAAKKAGLKEEEVQALLDSNDFFDEVRQDEYEASALGVQGVPYFIIDGSVAVPGALNTEDFVAVIENVLQKQKSTIAGSACGPDGCPIK